MVWFIAVPVVILWVIALIDIARRPLPAAKKAAWIIVVLLLPVVGTLIYAVLRKPTKEQAIEHEQAVRDLHGAGTGGRVGPPPPPVN